MFIKGYKMSEEHKRKIGLANAVSKKGTHSQVSLEIVLKIK